MEGKTNSKATQALAWQSLAAAAVWAYVIALSWHNDGLWYQGDAPVHAANGVFWLDFLRRWPSHPAEFAFSYYARYPVINPTAYPPLFYLLEAVLYAMVGISPFVGKGLVLGFALLGGIYLVFWLRHWVAPEAGWAGLLFLLQPAVMTWGNAVMPNLPSAVLTFAALYHWRRWLEDPGSRQIVWAALLALCATLTYTPMIMVVFVMIAWAWLEGRIAALFNRRALVLAGLCFIVLLPWAVISIRWAPSQRQVGLALGDYPVWKLASWTYYLRELPRIATIPVLVAAGIAFVSGLLAARWRREVLVGTSWFVISYLWFSIFSVKEPRFVLLLVPPLIVLATVAIVAILRGLLSAQSEWVPRLTVATLGLLLVFHLGAAYRYALPKVSGFQPIVAYLKQVAPDQWVFYDGYYSQLFSFYLRANDPGFQRGVVRGSKLLYATKIEPKFGLIERVSSPTDVLNRLQRECGCRYLAIEREQVLETAAGGYLRQALRGSDFRLVRSFTVDTPRVSAVDVYEYTGPLEIPKSFEIPFPVFGDRATLKIKPIQP